MNILSNLVLVLVFLITPLFSVSAPPSLFEVEQLGGSKIPVRMFGDEHYNWIETEDGYVIDFIEKDTHKGWYYRKLNNNGRFIPTNIPVEYPAPLDLPIEKYLREISPNIREFNNNKSWKPLRSSLSRKTESTQSIKPLIFLVNFDNLPSDMDDTTYTKGNFTDLIFTKNLNPTSAGFPSNYQMSVWDYFDEISNQKFDISGDAGSVVDWTKADNDYSYYVDGVQGTGRGNGPDGSDNYSQSASALVV
jgi:hypothetical protein